MPSKDPTVKRRAQERYRNSAKGKSRRAVGKKAWDENNRDKKNAHLKKWQSTSPNYKATQARKARERKYARKNWLHTLKSKLSCSECGFDKHPAALQFHHTGEQTKVAEIAKLVHNTGVSFDVIMEEMAKCVVLCANCHAIHHYKEHHKD